MTAKKLFVIALLASGLMLALGRTTTSIEAVSIKGITVSSTSALSSYLGPEQRICCGNENDQQRPAVVYNRYRNTSTWW